MPISDYDNLIYLRRETLNSIQHAAALAACLANATERAAETTAIGKSQVRAIGEVGVMLGHAMERLAGVLDETNVRPPGARGGGQGTTGASE